MEKEKILEGIAKEFLRRHGSFKKAEDFKRELGNAAKNIGCSTEELQSVVNPLIRELTEEMIGK